MPSQSSGVENSSSGTMSGPKLLYQDVGIAIENVGPVEVVSFEA